MLRRGLGFRPRIGSGAGSHPNPLPGGEGVSSDRLASVGLGWLWAGFSLPDRVWGGLSPQPSPPGEGVSSDRLTSVGLGWLRE